jgi:lambda repressor-like predicted transcriptional regulator
MEERKIPQHQMHRFEYLSCLLKNLRLNDGHSMREKAQQANLHYNTIYHSENVSNLTLLSLFELLDSYGVKVNEIFQDFE